MTSKPDARAAAQPQPKCGDKLQEDGQTLLCQLPLGHDGVHESGDTEWHTDPLRFDVPAARPAPPAPGLREALERTVDCLERVLALRPVADADEVIVHARATLTAPVPPQPTQDVIEECRAIADEECGRYEIDGINTWRMVDRILARAAAPAVEDAPRPCSDCNFVHANFKHCDCACHLAEKHPPAGEDATPRTPLRDLIEKWQEYVAKMEDGYKSIALDEARHFCELQVEMAKRFLGDLAALRAATPQPGTLTEIHSKVFRMTWSIADPREAYIAGFRYAKDQVLEILREALATQGED